MSDLGRECPLKRTSVDHFVMVHALVIDPTVPGVSPQKDADSASFERATETIGSFTVGSTRLAARAASDARPQMRLHHERIAKDRTQYHRHGFRNWRSGLIRGPCTSADAN
jgi:hypothetical protein